MPGIQPGLQSETC